MAQNIEEKLKEYRRKKEAEVQCTKSIWERIFPKNVKNTLKTDITNKNLAIAFESTLEKVSDVRVSDAVIPNKGVSNCSAQGKRIPHRPSFRERTQPQKATLQDKSDKQIEREQQNQSVQQLATDNQSGEFKNLLLFLKIILWVTLYLLCLELEFGAVYVIVSAFYIIFTNFRSGKRKPWEPSAYSVFNPGCEAIDGTLKPEQFEREIRYGF